MRFSCCFEIPRVMSSSQEGCGGSEWYRPTVQLCTRGPPPDQEQVVCTVWVQKQTFLGVNSKPGQLEGKATWAPYCVLGRPTVQRVRPLRWLLLVRERSWSSVGTWTSQHLAGRAGCLSWGLRSRWVWRPAGSLCRAPPACCPGPKPVPRRAGPTLATMTVSDLWHSAQHVC